MAEPTPAGRTDVVPVAPPCSRVRLDVFLHSRYPGVSRSILQRLIRDGAVLLDGRPVKATHQPRPGETITIHWPAPRPARVAPRALPLEILHEDDDLLVVNKSAGMVVHPAAGTEDNTLVNALLHHCRGRLSGIGGVVRPGIVHRLDQHTSGLIVVAKHDAAHLVLSRQFARRQVVKLYDALVCGHPPAAGEVDAAIARHPSHRKTMTVLAGGRPALTRFRTLERLAGSALLEVRIHTGRTHQIRVHFQHLGYPLVGDSVYGKRANARLAESTGFKAARQMLHARSLAFAHPATGAPLTFTAPWPGDFAEAVALLRRA